MELRATSEKIGEPSIARLLRALIYRRNRDARVAPLDEGTFDLG